MFNSFSHRLLFFGALIGVMITSLTFLLYTLHYPTAWAIVFTIFWCLCHIIRDFNEFGPGEVEKMVLGIIGLVAFVALTIVPNMYLAVLVGVTGAAAIVQRPTKLPIIPATLAVTAYGVSLFGLCVIIPRNFV